MHFVLFCHPNEHVGSCYYFICERDPSLDCEFINGADDVEAFLREVDDGTRDPMPEVLVLAGNGATPS